MTLTQLKYILAVESHGSFVKAAAVCNVAQPSLSAQIIKLEKELGVQIFERSNVVFKVTDVGQEILKQARIILSEADRIEDLCQVYKKEVRGILRLGIIPTISPYLIPHFMNQITDSFPHLKLEIHENKTENLITDLVKGLLDVAILSTPKVAPPQLMEKVLYYEPFVFFAGPQHALLKKKKISIADLKEYEPTLLDDTHCMRDQVEQVCQNKTSTESFILKSATLGTLIQVVSHQQGYTLLPMMALDGLPESLKKNQVVPFNEPIPTRKISLVYLKSMTKRSLIDAVQSVIIEFLPKSVLSRAQPKMKVLHPSPSHFPVK